ncbi:hypothetical protein, partial [Mucilaginibacter humi]|uniref:hypothetical protein n=1 Tax=Mucilaginibacter humi TaxID=2732510 RepID=UPI001C2E109B
RAPILVGGFPPADNVMLQLVRMLSVPVPKFTPVRVSVTILPLQLIVGEPLNNTVPPFANEGKILAPAVTVKVPVLDTFVSLP